MLINAKTLKTTFDIVLYQSNLLTDTDFKVFVSESLTSAILDSGASATVAGKTWFDSYYEGLSTGQQKNVRFSDSNSAFKFGCDQRFQSLGKATIPAKIGSTNILITTDIVDATVPLLLSKDAMKKAETKINFTNDEVTMFGEKQDVFLTKCGHYAIPLSDNHKIMKEINSNAHIKINLVAEDSMEKKKMAIKLHSQFAHPTTKKLLQLIDRAGLGSDEDLVEKVKQVQGECTICKEFSKPSPIPAVGLPHATKFNETVALDLKNFQGKIILHLIDHLTRFSSAVICKSKEPKVIVDGIFKAWISIFGRPGKFLSDNGGEFANPHFLDICETMNIRILTTAAYSPWSNGLVERHNATLSEMLHKVMAEQNTSIETALAWSIQAKNSLANVHGFSPSQLAIGYNPQMPSNLSNKIPAMEERDSESIVTEHLTCMKLARAAFIKSESAERIKRAIKHNIRPSAGAKYFTGDIVYYKRNDSRKWKGPGKVIGSDGSNILIKHGSQYVRVHTCRVLLEKRSDGHKNEVETANESQEKDEKSSEEEQSSDDEVQQSSQNRESITEVHTEEPIVGEREVMEDNGSMNFEDAQETLGSVGSDANEIPKLKKGLAVQIEKKDGNWEDCTMIRRTGKATGKYKDYWYVKSLVSSETNEYDMKNDIISYKLGHENVCADDNTNEAFLVDEMIRSEVAADIIKAKEEEWNKWIEENVYDEVPDEGQERVTTTWVTTAKIKDGKMVTKARLVARGYEEEKSGIRSDSPTCMKESIRMMLCIAMSRDWKIKSLDVKAAFLQGNKINRTIYLQPPKEFRKPKTIWKLNKVIYGLCDASRSWYLKVVEVLQNLGMKANKVDQAIFTYKDEDYLEGALTVHVDDVMFFGTEKFMNEVIQPFKDIFKISNEEEGAFKYLGVQMKQTLCSIELNQNEFLKNIKTEPLPKESMKDNLRYVNEIEKRLFRQCVGQLGWLANISKPEAAFSYCTLSTVQSKPQVADFKKFKKTIQDLQTQKSKLTIKKIDLANVRISIFTDASFANLIGGASQLGFIIFINDDSGNSAPIAWSSKKARRVARSTLTAETLAAVEGVDSAVMYKKLLQTLLNIEDIPVTLFSDNKSLCDAIKTTNVTAEKRLLVDLAALRQAVERK